jgi:hypothetical protein
MISRHSGLASAVTWRRRLRNAEVDVEMAGQLHTVAEAAAILKVRESWLKTKAAARLIPCTFVGKHLRFSDDDIAGIMKAGARQPVTTREPRVRRASA